MKSEKVLPLLLPIAYHAPISYYVQVSRMPHIQLELYETYPKQTIRNHCNILTANGVQKLSIPVLKPFGSKTKTKDILLDQKTNWKQLHWRALETAYNKSPYFEHYGMEYLKILEKPFQFLHEIDLEFFKYTVSLLQIDLNIIMTQSWEMGVNSHEDMRTSKFEVAKDEIPSYEKYFQVFSDRLPFVPNLSILDLIFNTGPEAKHYLKSLAKKLFDVGKM